MHVAPLDQPYPVARLREPVSPVYPKIIKRMPHPPFQLAHTLCPVTSFRVAETSRFEVFFQLYDAYDGLFQ